MEGLRFSIFDAEILYSVPKPGADLGDLIWYYMFINRVAPPPYGELADCLSKAFDAGILVQVDGDRFCLKGDWHTLIHQFDLQSANEIESMIKFEDVFIAREWPREREFGYRLNEMEYRATMTNVIQPRVRELFHSASARPIRKMPNLWHRLVAPLLGAFGHRK